ncbi:MAG: hypothetical protein J5962_01865 [Lachnospiraceae bacterium]|nr:hypothetical protein [Lachnospiraceae bacterium]
MITTWIKIVIILIVGIALLIMGIYGKCKVGKKEETAAYNTILLCGLCFILFGAFLCINHMMEEGLITDISNFSHQAPAMVEWFVRMVEDRKLQK